MEAKIPGGAFKIARKIFTSELWLKKPSTWKVIWIYIIGKVNHEPYGVLGEGEGFFNFTEEIKLIGNDCTPDKIKKFLQYARESSMISTMKSTRGMIIKVLNYSEYQDLDNFRRTTESTSKAREKHERSTTIYNNGNNGENGKKEKEEEKEILVSNPKEEKEGKNYKEAYNDFLNKEPELIDMSFVDEVEDNNIPEM
jgi:hypothetical protein